MQAARVFVASGALGQIVAANGTWLHRKPDDYYDVTWRRETGGGPILINAIHDIDCLRMVVGEIESVQAIASSKARGFPVEDTAAAVLRFANGALGTFIVSDATASPWNWEATSRESAITPSELENCFIVAGTSGSLSIPQLQHRSYDKPDGAWADPLTRRTLPVPACRPLPAPASPFRPRHPRRGKARDRCRRRRAHARGDARHCGISQNRVSGRGCGPVAALGACTHKRAGMSTSGASGRARAVLPCRLLTQLGPRCMSAFPTLMEAKRTSIRRCCRHTMPPCT